MAISLDTAVRQANIASLLDESKLKEIAQQVLEGLEKDKQSREEWDKHTKAALDLVCYKNSESKSWPFENASNIKFPLLTRAIIHFSARSYPLFVSNGQVVGAKVMGNDPDGSEAARASRISKYMSYQLLYKSKKWEPDTDKLLQVLPLYGTVYRKVYYDPIKKENVSELCLPSEIYVNHWITSIEEARRVSHCICVHKNLVLTRMRSGAYRRIDIDLLLANNEQYLDQNKDMHDLVEQHCYLDLDDDMYEEPYIVTIHKESQEVLRIVSRYDLQDIQRNDKNEVIHIEPIQYFTDYHFIPSFDGGYHSLGYAHLLLHPNTVVNSLLNQLVDAGTLANLQTFIAGRGFKVPGGQLEVQPGRVNKLDILGQDLGKEVMPLNYKEPSPTLLKLLEMMIETTKDLASTTDVLSGTQNGTNVPATTAMILEKQGLQIYSSIQRRLYRSFKKEFDKLWKLNQIYFNAEEYANVLNMPVQQVLLLNDFNSVKIDVLPVADPNLSSDVQKLTRAQAELQLAENPLIAPQVNVKQVLKDYLTALEVPNVEQLIGMPAAPSPDLLQTQMDMQQQQINAKHKETELAIKNKKVDVEALKARADNISKYAGAIKDIADAKATTSNTKFSIQTGNLKSLMDVDKHIAEMHNNDKGSQDRNEGMEAEPGDAGISGNPTGAPDYSPGGPDVQGGGQPPSQQ